MLSILASGSGLAQSFSDDFESYKSGDNLAATSNKWETWSSPNGGADDVKITNTKYKSGTNSVYFVSTATSGGPSDIVLPFGGMLGSGNFTYKMSMFVDAGKNAYLNLQEQTTVGKGYTIDVYFNNDKTLNINNATAGNLVNTTYSQGKWFDFELKIDLNTNSWDLYLDGTKSASFQNASRAISSIDIFPINGSSFYIDDVSYSYTAANSVTTNASITYIGNVAGFLAGSKVIPTLEIRNLGSTTITAADVSILYNGNTDSKKLSGLSIAAGNLYTVTMDNSLTISSGKSDVVGSVTSVNGAADEVSADNSKTISINPIVPATGKVVIGEEATGTWCQWCPRGAVALKTMHAKYDGFFQGIAVHNNDPMMNSYYNNGMASKISGYPSALVDRGTKIDPSAMGGDFITRVQIAPKGTLSFAALFDGSKSELRVSVKTTLASDISGDYRIACALVEDGVHGTASGFSQSNAYAGGGSGIMGGFEKLPNPVPATKMVYDHVGRAIAPTFSGLPNAYGNSAKSGQSFVHNFTFVMDPSWDMSKMKIVGMIIDNLSLIDNGGVSNMGDALMKTFEKGTEVMATEQLNGPDSKIEIYPNPSKDIFGVIINQPLENLNKIEVINPMGQIVLSQKITDNLIKLDAKNWSVGVYTLRLSIGDLLIQRRIVKN